jgi:ribonuclease-3|tara:strand:- start:2445 stop:3104 length:660 start_codon:yes stop_codon:yes gene_type:complete
LLLDQFEKKINYKFNNQSLLIEALTHSSSSISSSPNYERLEFLGDRVLGLILAEYFFKLFPEVNEGCLNDYYQKYANQDFLAECAQNLNISDFIQTQKGDNLYNNKSILSDVVESLIGAIYIDSNINECRDFIEKKILNMVSKSSPPLRHSKSLLQELCLKKYKELPKYSMINKSGPDHNPVFTVSVSINEDNVKLGEGSSLRIAEEIAASKLLEFLNI